MALARHNSLGANTLNSITITLQVINLEPPYTTACRSEPLETGQAYSLKACLRICQEKYIYDACGCYPAINFMNGMLSTNSFYRYISVLH